MDKDSSILWFILTLVPPIIMLLSIKWDTIVKPGMGYIYIDYEEIRKHIGQYVVICYAKISEEPLTIGGKLKEVTKDGRAKLETDDGEVSVWPLLEVGVFEDREKDE